MEELKKLQNIGAKEIVKNTHMAFNKVQYILEKDYENLKDCATTYGLLQILEREYGVDLSQWREEYAEFWGNAKSQNNALPQVDFKVMHETVAQRDSKKGLFFGFLVAVLLGVGFYVYLNFSSPQEQDVSSVESKEIVQEEIIQEEVAQEVQTNIDNNATIEVTQDADASASTPINTLQTEQNALIESESIEKVESNNTQTPKKIEIVPAVNVWIGIIYLDTRKKVSIVTDKPLEIDLNRPQAITTGHGELAINADGVTQEFVQKEKMLFLVDENGNFSQATQNEYNEKTRGLRW